MEMTQKILLVITIIGALNWGLVGLFDINLIANLFGNQAMFSRIIYVAVALCGIINIGILLSHIEFRKD